MSLRAIFASCLLWGAGLASADEVALNPSHPETYTVEKGDTLWDISARFLQNPWQWPEIWHGNPQVRDPHWIFPGDVLTLRYVDGRPQLSVERPSELRLSPQIRSTPLDYAIPVIPMNAIRQFLVYPKVVDAGYLEQAPYLVEFPDEHVVAGAGDRIYVRGIQGKPEAGYMLFRPGPPYRDGKTGEVLGYEALFVGEAALEQGGDPSVLQLTRSAREAVLGDRLLPIEELHLQMQYQPHAPKSLIDGKIIHVVDGVSQIGQYAVVIIDRGKADGLETGHVLDVYRGGYIERDVISGRFSDSVRIPEDKAGLLLVFRPFERVSYGLIMTARGALHVGDSVRTP